MVTETSDAVFAIVASMIAAGVTSYLFARAGSPPEQIAGAAAIATAVVGGTYVAMTSK